MAKTQKGKTFNLFENGAREALKKIKAGELLDEACFDGIDVDAALKSPSEDKIRPQTYIEIMLLCKDPANTAFQDLFSYYYYLTVRSNKWRKEYFKVFEKVKESGTKNISEVLRLLFEIKVEKKQDKNKPGKKSKKSVELSFASKMLATLYPDEMPIFDSKVVAALTKKNKLAVFKSSEFETPERRLEIAADNYQELCAFYVIFQGTDKWKECVKKFDKKFPAFAKDIKPLKKVDFILWRLGSLD